MFYYLKILLGPASFILLQLLPIASMPSKEAQSVLGLLVWMILWWLLEIVPLFVTALLPILIFPLMGVMSVSKVTPIYGSDVIFLFLGGFLIAGAIEKWNLHRQISLWIVKFFGCEPRRVILGFIVATGVVSMWISNTAAVLIMLPLAASLAPLYLGHGDGFERALRLGVGYAASVGGIATIIGSPPNALLVGHLERSGMEPVSFLKWMMFGMPLAIGGLIILWFYLTRIAYKIPVEQSEKNAPMIPEPLRLDITQRRILILFCMAALGWVVRPFVPIAGLSDVHVGIFFGILMFLMPASREKGGPKILETGDLSRVEWSILLLFGGGLSLSEGIDKSGLGSWIGSYFQIFQTLPDFFVLLCICAALILLTEFASNTAVASIFIPVMAAVGPSLNIQNEVLLMTVVMAGSLSFMLPMATPPNAIVFGRAGITIREMARVGLGLNLIFALLITFATYFLLPIVWNLGPK